MALTFSIPHAANPGPSRGLAARVSCLSHTAKKEQWLCDIPDPHPGAESSAGVKG